MAINDATDLQALVLTDDNTPPAEGTVNIRFVNGAPSGGMVDVFITPLGTDISAATPTIDDADFLSVSEYLPANVGDYQIQVTDPADATDVLLDTGSVILEEGQILTVVLVEDGFGNIDDLVVLNDNTDFDAAVAVLEAAEDTEEDTEEDDS